MRDDPGTEAPRAARAATPALLALGLLAAVAAAAEVRVAAVEPSRTDGLLQCTVVTTGLPDTTSRETLASGLPSSLTLALALLDVRGGERGEARAEVRIEPDPWERTFRVRWPGVERQARGLEEVALILSRLGPITVAPLRAADAARQLRVRVRIAVHPLAPAEAEQAHALVSGDMGGGGADRREVSAGFGSLLRFFLGRSPEETWTAQATSPPFDARTLPRPPPP